MVKQSFSVLLLAVPIKTESGLIFSIGNCKINGSTYMLVCVLCFATITDHTTQETEEEMKVKCPCGNNEVYVGREWLYLMQSDLVRYLT